MSRNKRKPRPRKHSTAQKSRHQQRPQPGLPAETRNKSSWRFIAVIALIAVPLLGAWAYLNWTGANITEPETTKLSSNGPETSKLPSKTDAAVTPGDPAPSLADDESPTVWQTEGSLAESWNKMDNPSSDGWDTEIIASQVTDQLSKLQKLMTSADPIDAAALSELVVSQVSVQPLLPPRLETTFQDEVLNVKRAIIDSENSDPSATLAESAARSQQGAGALAEAILEITAPYVDREKLRVKLKVFRVEKQEHGVATHQSVEIFGPTGEGLLEENAIWVAHWQYNGLEDTPLLARLRVTEYESVERVGGPLFVDCTESVLGHHASFQKQLLQGYNHWLQRSQFHRFLNIIANPGLAVGDVNGDGLNDIYVCQEAGLPNLLYLQNADGTVSDYSRQSGVDWLQNSSTALIVDLDNDHHEDLVVAVTGGVVLAKGDGSGHFSIIEVLDTGDHVMALAAADYDRDGLLDLYVGAYFPDGVGEQTETIVPGSGGQLGEAGIAGRNSLFHNLSKGDAWSFEEVTDQLGLDANNYRYTLAAAWEDYDNDGDQDLYVANDYGWNNLYRNDLNPDGTGSFVDIAVPAGAKDNAFGMSVAWGDYDRDGWMDLYVSNMFSYAGNRITFQNQFKSGASEDVKERFQRLARGNTLLRNLGPPGEEGLQKFEDRTLDVAVNRGRWAWGSCFVDVNNDGWEDLVVANGYITTDDNGDL